MADDPVRVEDAEALYEVPVAAFVAARDDLVRRLRADGHVEEAARVKALRRPTLAAWAVNQVVRRDGATWEALIAAGEAARRAQRRALSGVADSGLREAAVARREAVEAALVAAVAHLEDAGARPDGHLDDVAATFEAVIGDAAVAEDVGAGMLSSPVAAPDGLAGLAALTTVPPDPVDDEVRSGEPDPAAEQRRAAMRALETARAHADTRRRAAKAARTEAATRREQADEARRSAEQARAAAEQAEAAAREAVARADHAEEEAAAATEAARHADQAEAAARAALDELA